MKKVGVLEGVIIGLFVLSIAQATNKVEFGLISSNLLNQTEFDRSAIQGDSVYLDSFIRVTMGLSHIPGLATYIIKDGQCIWNGVYGYANLEDSIPVADTTIFVMASVSKTFTATALMQLWERGLFNLDDNINDYLPFDVINPYCPDSVITIYNLLTHTSSIEDNWPVLDSLDFWGGDHHIPLLEFLENYLVPGGAYYDPVSNFYSWLPGTRWEYCNVNFGLIGHIVQMLADSFPVYCQDSIFDPLNMNETSWFYADLDTSNIAIGYDYIGGSYVPYGLYSFVIYPAGMVKTSSAQLAQWITAFLQYGQVGGQRILDSTTVKLMLTPQGGYSTNYPPGADSIGLGWFFDICGNRQLWNHKGGTYGYCNSIDLCFEENTGVIALCNGHPYDTYYGIYDIVYELFEYAAQYGIGEKKTKPITKRNFGATIFSGPLQLPEGKECKVFDITGRVVTPSKMRPGIYFIEVDGQITRKVVKVR